MDPIVSKIAPRSIPVARPYLAGRKGKFLADCLENAWVSGGKYVERFEAMIASQNSELSDVHGVACNSGTTALHLALKAIRVLPGESVILPTLTMVAVANAVRYCNANPRFVDSLEYDGSMSPIESIGPLINGDVKAIVVPHLYGSVSCVSRKLRELGYEGWIIQDCAEAHYATTAGRLLLQHERDVLTFSFYANKIIATGEGGMVVCACETMAERLRSLRAHAFTPGNHFHHQELAFGYRMTDLQAAIGIAQCERYLKLLRIRQRHAIQYFQRLADIPWIEFPGRSNGGVWWVFPILVRREWSDRVSVERVREVLADRGIETRRYFTPLHLQPHLQEFALPHQTFPVACDLHQRGLYLPLYVGLRTDDIDYVCDAVRSV